MFIIQNSAKMQQANDIDYLIAHFGIVNPDVHTAEDQHRIRELMTKYDTYNGGVFYALQDNSVSSRFYTKPKGPPQLYDALISGSDLPLADWSQKQVCEQDVIDILRLIPTSKLYSSGVLRCRDKVPPFVAALVNSHPSCTTQIIKILIHAGFTFANQPYDRVHDPQFTFDQEDVDFRPNDKVLRQKVDFARAMISGSKIVCRNSLRFVRLSGLSKKKHLRRNLVAELVLRAHLKQHHSLPVDYIHYCSANSKLPVQQSAAFASLLQSTCLALFK